MRRYLSLILTMSMLPALAQYDQNIAVEGKYVPEYINHDRIGRFPKAVSFPMEKSALEYSLTGVNADFTPQAVPIQATGWRTTPDFISHRGYLELGLGSWLESTLSAGYRIIDTRESALGVRLQHNSTSLWKPGLIEDSNIKMERYDEALGIYGAHTFGEVGRLEGALDYHLGCFDYYGFLSESASEKAPTQTLNDFAARLSWHSLSTEDSKVTYSIGAGARYFGYRRFYLPDMAPGTIGLKGDRETDVNLRGSVAISLSSKSIFGLELDGDLLHYGNPEWREQAIFGSDLSQLDTYGLVSLTPYYRFTRDRLNVRLGARLDLAFNAGMPDDRYGVFHAAPSIRVDYNAGPVMLFLHALGGSYLNTLAAGYDNDYYQSPGLANTTPVYTPVDASLGFTFGPFSGVHAGFDVAFRASRGQYFGGWYQTYMNGLNGLEALNLPMTKNGESIYYDFSPGARSNLSGFSFGLNLGYDSGRYFKFDARGRYQHQNGTTGYFNGYDRPECTISVSVETNPWSTLKFKIGYDLRALRMMPVRAYYAGEGIGKDGYIEMYRLPNLSMLNFGVSYALTQNFNIWAQADNLLNRKSWYMPGLPEPGIRAAAGIGLTF